MTRDSKASIVYWNKRIDRANFWIKHEKEASQTRRTKDPDSARYNAYTLINDYLELMLCCYSRGDSIYELKPYFTQLLDCWKEYKILAEDESDERKESFKRYRDNWSQSLIAYIRCFWLVGLALALEVPEDQWQRLLKFIDNEGKDELLDRIISSRQPRRKIGNKLCHPKPYQLLLDAIDAPKEKQAQMLFKFVSKWYNGLKPRPRPYMHRDMPRSPMWYVSDKHISLGDGSGYFGHWCVEAVATVKAFGLDDSLCLGHEHYPGDLLRPNGPSTHPIREDIIEAVVPTKKDGFFSRLFRFKRKK